MSAAAQEGEDHRAWQHGTDLIHVGEKLLLVWASPGNPPRANPGGDWQHDVYYAWLNPLAENNAASIIPQILVAKPEAQEPPSVAINSRGTILMTSEDGSDDINQYAGLWNSRLQVLKPYPLEIRRGGHSGHVAAMRDRFLIVYGEGWIERGGFRDLGTGKDIHARIVDNDGRRGREIDIAAGHRDGWPLVAGSDRNWLAVWQRYPEMTLHTAVVDDAGKVSAPHRLMDNMPVRYAYDVAYSPPLGLYVVTGTTGAEGFIALLDRRGDVVTIRRGLPPMVSESRLVLGNDGNQVIGVYPASPRGISVVRLSAQAIEPLQRLDHPYLWDYSGTTGAFIAPKRVLFATLSTAGLQLITVDLAE